jgi:hypothetical protein
MAQGRRVLVVDGAEITPKDHEGFWGSPTPPILAVVLPD